MAQVTGAPRVEPARVDGAGRVVLEGGGIEVNGAGTVLVTEEWLLSDVQVPNPGLRRADSERDLYVMTFTGVRRIRLAAPAI